jgi:putative NIF3 family GTP cyclohydrolase 1 type 2
MAYTVQSIIDTILKEVPGAPLPDTVDTIKSGDGGAVVTGIVTTFIATMDVLRKAVDLGANFIITHEPTYFNHRDDVSWLANDPVYAAKRGYIDDHHLTIWRFHDHWHAYQPDGIVTGLKQLLDWTAYQDAQQPVLFHIPATTLGALAEFFRERLGIPHMRIVGPADMRCQTVALVVGSYPGNWQIMSLGEYGADVLVCGEASEWQVYEYVRDANGAGLPKGLIVLGHERSEEPGMAYLATWLRERFPGLSITHVPAGDPLVIR